MKRYTVVRDCFFNGHRYRAHETAELADDVSVNRHFVPVDEPATKPEPTPEPVAESKEPAPTAKPETAQKGKPK